MGWKDLSFVTYEETNGLPTGFKVYKQFQQVGTLEKRDGLWILAFMVSFKLVTLQHESFEFCVNEFYKALQGEK